MVQDRLMFLLSSSAVEGTYSLELVFFLPLLGMNSLTHSPLAAAISLKIGRVEILLGDDMVRVMVTLALVTCHRIGV